MSTGDFSRWLHRPSKHYSGARLQTGRPIIDSDFNEDRVEVSSELRQAMLDVVGARAAIDDGFLPDLTVGDTRPAKTVRFGEMVEASVLDYDIRPGSVSVGGRRFEQLELEPVVFQREFLQNGPSTSPRASLGTYRQLSVLRGWEQLVSVVEDGELQEAALHGADGAVRSRTMRQVEVHDVEAESCSEAFEEVLENLTEAGAATYDAQSCELRSNARLQMTFVAGESEDCPPCAPQLGGRYLGSEDHTIRVMLTSATTYVWAFDDAAPLYRAKVVIDKSGGVAIELLTPPKDAFHQPGANSVIELLPWSVLLENGASQATNGKGKSTNKAFSKPFRNEKLATRLGIFAQVDQGYEPATRTLHAQLGSAALAQLGLAQTSGQGQSNKAQSTQNQSNKGQVSQPQPSKGQPSNKGSASQPTPSGKTQSGGAQPSGKGDSTVDVDVVALRWDEAHPFANELNPGGGDTDGITGHLYLRIWQRDTSDQAAHVAIDSKKPLGRTGLVPVFSGKGRAGDYWIVSARRSQPELLWPHAVMDPSGIPPVGPVDVICPISLVTWKSISSTLHQVVAHDDCRPRLPKLTDRGCCSLTVSADGRGDHTSIQAAIDDLPISGGRICVRPGVYVEELLIRGRSDVTLEGCGGSTLLRSPEQPESDALVRVELEPGQGNVCLRRMSIEPGGQIGLHARGEALRFEHLSITTRAARASNRSALVIDDGRNVVVRRCRITMNGSFSDDAAVFLRSSGLGLRFQDNEVVTLGQGQSDTSHAWGGVQVGGGSRGVLIERNRILGGRGHGVTLGSVSFRAPNGREWTLPGAGLGLSESDAPFALRTDLLPVTLGDSEFFPEPDEEIAELELRNNVIRGAGGSGIAAPALLVDHDEVASSPPLCHRRRRFHLLDSTISDNQVSGNANGAVSEERSVVRGGIVLSCAKGVSIRGNHIRDQARRVTSSVSGIVIATGRFVRIESNQLRGNGLAEAASSAWSGGIVVSSMSWVNDDNPRLEDVKGIQRWSRATELVDALRIDGNVVEQPSGPALRVWARGACSFTNNHLSSTGSSSTGLGPKTVYIVHASRLAEAVDLPPNEPHPSRWVQPQDSERTLTVSSRVMPVGTGCGVIFSSNHVSSLWKAAESDGVEGHAVGLLSTSSVSMCGNQFAARVPDGAMIAGAFVVAACVDVSDNRIAEGVDATELSLACMGPIATSSVGNTTTHCQVAHGLNNHGDPRYFVAEDNLVWLRPHQGCEAAVKAIVPDLRRYAGLLLGLEGRTYSDAFGIERKN